MPASVGRGAPRAATTRSPARRLSVTTQTLAMAPSRRTNRSPTRVRTLDEPTTMVSGASGRPRRSSRTRSASAPSSSGKRPTYAAPLTIVVGSSSVRTRVGDLLVRRLGAIANVCVVTLSRLAGDLVVAARGAPRPTLAGIARERLIRRLVASRDLAYFAPVQDRPHFPRAVAATFADLREARVAPASDWARTAFRQGAAADTPSSEAKAADLQGLYAAYCDELARRRLADGAQLLLEAAEAVRRTHAATEPADRPRVVLYGIYDLNQAQEAFVRELLGAGADLFVPVPRGGSGDGAGALDAARAAGFAERALVPPDPVADHERLAELWRAGPRIAGSAVELRGDGTLTVASVPDERAETREAARHSSASRS